MYCQPTWNKRGGHVDGTNDNNMTAGAVAADQNVCPTALLTGGWLGLVCLYLLCLITSLSLSRSP